MSHPEVLDEQVISRSGSFWRVKRWLRGIHPEKGVITRGWTGWETVEETNKIAPIHTFRVRSTDSQPN